MFTPVYRAARRRPARNRPHGLGFGRRSVSHFCLVAAGLILPGLSGCGEVVVTAPVQEDSIRAYIEEQGKTRLPRDYEITMPETGRLLPITLNEGDRVEQGDVVARMHPRDLELAEEAALASVKRLEASVAEHRDEALEQHAYEQTQQIVQAMEKVVATAVARAEASQVGLSIVSEIRDRAQTLRQQNAGSEEDLDRAQLEYVNSSLTYRQDSLIAEAVRLIDTATRLLPVMVQDYMQRRRLTAETVARQLDEAQVDLDRAQLRVERGVMTSPVNGVVLDRAIDSERLVDAGTVLLRIGDLDELQVEAEVLSTDVTRIRPGAPVEIYGETVLREPGNGLSGQVLRIDPEGFTKISSLGVEQQRVQVIVQFASEARDVLEELRVGVDYRVRVRIVTNARENTLVVPRTALFRGTDGTWQTFVVDQGRLRQTTVRVGLMNEEMAEILDGVTAGDRLVLAPDNRLVDGARVRPQNP